MEKEKIFKKNYKDVQNITFITLFCNIILAIGKLLGGIFGLSKALISDSINSFGDIITSFITLIGAKISSKKADKNHPYGHEKISSIAIIIFEMLVIFSGLIIGYTAIKGLITPEEIVLPDLVSLIVASVCVGVKFILFLNALIFYKKTKSSILKAQMFDHLFDSIGTFLSLLGIIIAIYLKIDWLDSVFSLIICILIIIVAIKVIIENISCLVDQNWSNEKDEEIQKIVEKCKEIKQIDFIKTRKFGDKVYVDIEVSMDKNLSLYKAHEIIDNLEKEIESTYIEVIHVAIHINPY